MGKQPRLLTIATLLLVAATFLLGSIGWFSHGDLQTLPTPADRLLEALFRTLVSFSPDGLYVQEEPRLTWPLQIARWTGALSTLIVLLFAAVTLLGERYDALRTQRRRHHHLLIGATTFSLVRAERLACQSQKPLTVLVPEQERERMKAAACQRSTRIVAMEDQELASLPPLAGRDFSHIDLGSASADFNLTWARTLSGYQPASWSIRIEDSSIARDFEPLMPWLGRAELYSVGQIVARSLVSAMDLPGMALIRGQERIHVVLIGMGKTGVSLIETIALRCAGTTDRPIRLSVFDNEIEAARTRLFSAMPTLGDVLDIRFHAVDARLFSAGQGLEQLIGVESELPITAIVVATGNDARNTGIAVRLRQVQLHRMQLRAPIFVRNQSMPTVAPAPVTDLSGGTVFFGGLSVGEAEVRIEDRIDKIARAMHDAWLRGQSADQQAALAWNRLSHQQRRASIRGAEGILELLRTAGLSPPVQAGNADGAAAPADTHAGFAIAAAAATAILADTAVMERLSRYEHDRWLAERRTDGWRQSPTGRRDDEKKLHKDMVPWEELSAESKSKDRGNVELILRRCAEWDDGGACWRRRLRIGLVGRLHMRQEVHPDRIRELLEAWMRETGRPAEQFDLEVVTPNAPGFDRTGAAALLTAWEHIAGRKGRLLRLEAARPAMLDTLAKVDKAECRRQSALLDRAAAETRVCDMRPLGMSDADIQGSDTLFKQARAGVETRLDALCDLVIVATEGDDRSESGAFLNQRLQAGRACLRFS